MLPVEPHPAVEPHGAGEVSRGFHGERADELHVLVRPGRPDDLASQTRSVYEKLGDILRFAGQSPGQVVSETVYFRDVDRDLSGFREARRSALAKLPGGEAYRPASMFVGQPPLAEGALLELLVTTCAESRAPGESLWTVTMPAACQCAACGTMYLRVLRLGSQKHLYAGNVVGVGRNAYEEAHDMFQAAEQLLGAEGADFQSVVRTWIYLREMERDYAAFNRARRAFFDSAGVKVLPASTGIQGAPFVGAHRFSLGFHAIRSARPVRTEPMTTATLNEAPDYGSDFSRGLKITETDRTRLYVSGTASVDEKGHTVHAGDLELQVERMLLNVSTLLENQGASFDDVVRGVTYLKHAADADRLRRIYREAELVGFPHALVNAHVCRPDLLCEIEVTAVVP